MRRNLALLLTVSATLAPLCAQDFTISQAPARDITVSEEVVTPKPSVEGIVKDVFTKKPWQMVNPAAPAKYGTGEKLVSKDFGPATPYHSTGFVVAGVEW